MYGGRASALELLVLLTALFDRVALYLLFVKYPYIHKTDCIFTDSREQKSLSPEVPASSVGPRRGPLGHPLRIHRPCWEAQFFCTPLYVGYSRGRCCRLSHGIWQFSPVPIL